MHTTPEELKKIAALACINMNEASQNQLTHDVSAIMDFVEALRDVDTQHVSPLLHPLDLQQRLRADEVCESNQVENLQKIAPQFADNHYLVPKVIEIGK